MQASQPPSTNPIVAVKALPNIAFVEAKWYRRGTRRARAIWIVLHATHGAEHKRAAEDGARELQMIPPKAMGGRPRSTHVFIDTDSVVQCVPWESESYHGGAFANMYGEGVELCGRADQTREEWFDALSLPMLNLAAHFIRWRSEQLFIPLIYRGPKDLVNRVPGVTTHAAITEAFPGSTDHWDPGPAFPMTELLEAARRLVP